MIDRIKRIPELRFSNFYNEWQEKKLGDLGKTYTGLSGKTKTDFGFGDSHFITYMNVFKNNIAKFEMTEKVKISNNEKQNKVNYGDIFFTTSSEVPQEVGMTSIWLFKTNNVYLNSFCFGFRITINNVLPIFLARYLRSENIRKKITILAQGSTRFNLSKKEVMKLSINFPEINEQQKIGDFFSKLDRQIELEEQKLSFLEEQKKGYMQKIFSQELRFKDEKGNDYPEWDITTIEKIAKVSKGFTPSTKDINLWQNDNKNWLSIAGMSDKYIYEGNKGISSAGEGKHKKVNKDTLIMSFKLTLGKLAIVKTPIYTNEAICHFEWKTNQLKTEYMYYYLSFINIKSFGAQAVKGITLNNDSINSILIKLPGFLEQNKISNFFTKFDELIEKQNQKIDGLKKRKKGFLQKMFV